MKRSFFLMAGCCAGLSLMETPLMAETPTGLPVIIRPDDPRLAYTGFAELQVTPDAAAWHRTVTDTAPGYTEDAPGGVIRFRTAAAAGAALVEYLPKSAMAGRIHYHSTGVLLVDGRRAGTFTRPDDAGGVVRIPLPAAGQAGPHTCAVVLPYADAVRFRGLRLPAGATLLPLPPEPPRPRYVAYGDSITHGFLAADAPGGYAWQLAEQMHWQLVNLGFGSRAATPDDGRRVAALKPDVVTILLGVNDCLGKIPPATFAANYRQVLDAIRRERPAIPVVVITPLDVPGKWAGSEPLEQYRQALRDLARERHDQQLFVVEGVPLIPPDLTLFADGLHPNDHGFQIMAARLAAQLAPMLKRSTP